MDVMGRFTSNVTGQVRPSLERKKNFKNFFEFHRVMRRFPKFHPFVPFRAFSACVHALMCSFLLSSLFHVT
jgi:hypothetical protein